MYETEPKLNHKLCRLAVSLLVGLWAVTPGWVNALPTDGKVVSGIGSIMEPTPQQMEILQTTPNLAIDWQSFNIGAKESVTFKQPGINSVALNRVIGVDPSIILGKLSGNGQVFLSNPSGVVFGNGSVVDVHGLLATTFNIIPEDFMAGNYNFSQDATRPLAAIINNGKINAKRYVGLVAPAVENTGSIIVADLGTMTEDYEAGPTLDFNGDGLISFAVTREVSNLVTDPKGNLVSDQIINSGIIRANSGKVLITTRLARDVISNVVNHSGVTEAQTVLQKNGKIVLSSGAKGSIQLSGTLDAPDVNIYANTVKVAANKSLSTNNGDIKILALELDLKGDLDAGTGNVHYSLADSSDLRIGPGNPKGMLGGNDIGHIIAENLILETQDGDIHVKGLKEKDTNRINGSVIMRSGNNINFDTVASVFPALELFAIADINVNVDVTTTKGDFAAKADIENNGIGDFNVAPDVVITSARDIDVSAPNINVDDDEAFNETRDLILNGKIVNPPLPPDPTISPEVAESISQGSLGTFLTEFFENGGPGGC